MNESITMSNQTWRTIVQLPSGESCLAVYMCLLAHTDFGKGLCCITREEIAEECNISVKTVGKVIGILKENGFIDWTTEFKVIDIGNSSYWKYCNNYKIFPQNDIDLIFYW